MMKMRLRELLLITVELILIGIIMEILWGLSEYGLKLRMFLDLQ
jgi:hypothetical protein